MRHLFQPNKWSCLPTCLAMALDLELPDVFERIGHDGSEILWSDLPDPQRRRAFAYEEIIPICLDELVYPVLITKIAEYKPLDTSVDVVHTIDHSGLIHRAMEKRDGILLGMPVGANNHHAVAWCASEGKCYDPDGGCCKAEDFDIHHFVAMF
jgi:hypothetical protein